MKKLQEADVARHAELIANRAKKNKKRLAKAFERQNVGAYRLYDWDIPEVRAVVDWYEGELVVAEYVRDQTAHLTDYVGQLAAAVQEAVGARRSHTKQRRSGQAYGRLQKKGREISVRERDLEFLVNLEDFIDTGLFSDHRDTRQRIKEEAAGKRFLNLFAYTGTFTCAAARGGAKTTTVDLSGRYLEWAERNLDLNRLPHGEMIKADAVELLSQTTQRYDVILLDPPSTSSTGLDIQRDHRGLIEAALARLTKRGVLYFSTNHQRFEPHLDGLRYEEITEETVPVDYRNRQIHRCFRLTV